jgi:ferrochelatase
LNEVLAELARGAAGKAAGMTFRVRCPLQPRPASAHGVLLVNLGTPDEPTAPALRRYLAEFLSDRRVVEIPRLVWLPILHGIILRTRPAKSAAKYASVWMPEGLAAGGVDPAPDRSAQAPAHEPRPRRAGGHAMRYGNPSIAMP